MEDSFIKWLETEIEAADKASYSYDSVVSIVQDSRAAALQQTKEQYLKFKENEN